MARERGQATIEWTGVVLLVALALGAAVAFVPAVDGRSFGALIARALVCAVRGDCSRGADALDAAYGPRDAELVRRYTPGLVYEPGTYTLPVDFRRCRAHRCSDAPDDRDLDAHRATRGGAPATAFTHVVHRGGDTFIQYWLYYPDSNSVFPGSRRLWSMSPLARAASWAITGKRRYPGFHPDDWESVQVRVDAGGNAWVRASSHHGYQGCKQRRCHNRWTPWTGWARVSKGSHAGHVPLRSEPAGPRRWAPRGRSVAGGRRDVPLLPGRDLRERTTTAPWLELVPLETVDRSAYRPLDDGIKPPWEKEVWTDPLSDSTS